MDSEPEDMLYEEASSEEEVLFAIKDQPGSVDKKVDDDDYQFEILSSDQIMAHMADTIKEVNTIVELSPTITRVLLNYFKWDKEKLMERYYDMDQVKLFKDANVTNPIKNQAQGSSKRKSSNTVEHCRICYLDFPVNKMHSVECGHSFCAECWVSYLKTKIMDEGEAQTITCAEHKCDILVDDGTVMSLISDPHVKLKYQLIITNTFVEFNKRMRWCPTPSCAHAIKVQYTDCKPVTCVCEKTICFKCGEDWHDPLKCDMLKKWLKKCSDDSETCKWISVNTKECPKCNTIIEKNGGCNKMTCKKCKGAFCWSCTRPWQDHTSDSAAYACNRFDEGKDPKERSKSALNRYLFHYTRYANHQQSLKFESQLYEAVGKKMEEIMQANLMGWVEVQFLKKAVDVLCSCRQILMHTYAFAFYSQKNNHFLIFEDNQMDLERVTETLSEYLERDITSDNLEDIKQKVLDMSIYCDSRKKALLEQVHEGYEKNFWQYQNCQ